MNIGKKFASLRADKGVSVYKLAKVTEITESYIHTIEKGDSQPSIHVLSTLLSVLGVSVSEFFNENDDILYPSKQEKELIKRFRSLDDEKASAILQMIDLLNK